MIMVVVDMSHYELHYVNRSCILDRVYEEDERW